MDFERLKLKICYENVILLITALLLFIIEFMVRDPFAMLCSVKDNSFPCNMEWNTLRKSETEIN